MQEIHANCSSNCYIHVGLYRAGLLSSVKLGGLVFKISDVECGRLRIRVPLDPELNVDFSCRPRKAGAENYVGEGQK